MVVSVKFRPERLNRIDGVEREKERVILEERRRKEEEERLVLLDGLNGVFQCRGRFKLFVGRSPRSELEVRLLEEQMGVTTVLTADVDVALLIDSNLCIRQIRACSDAQDLDRERKALKEMLLDEECVLVCARDVRVMRDLYWAQRLVDERRTSRQVKIMGFLCICYFHFDDTGGDRMENVVCCRAADGRCQIHGSCSFQAVC
jgi:hypothetical protein